MTTLFNKSEIHFTEKATIKACYYNGILNQQEATGEMRLVGDSEVVVMRGSYEYIGADNNVYVVEWEADENGFRPSAAHLPKSVPIPFPEQQEAVNAQIRFAAEEDELNLRAAASNFLPAYASALPAYAN
jgi:CO/xanthine dehydrogenase Mo-binding subunit